MDEPGSVDALRRGRGQRRRHAVGDWFACQLERDGTYRVGVIVATGEHTAAARFPGGILAYLYEPSFVTLPAEAPDLDIGQLLMPPFFTHPQMWRLGCFRTFAHRVPEPARLVPRHCFLDVDFRGDLYVGEGDRILDRRYEPCGHFFGQEVGRAVDGTRERGAVTGRARGVCQARSQAVTCR